MRMKATHKMKFINTIFINFMDDKEFTENNSMFFR